MLESQYREKLCGLKEQTITMVLTRQWEYTEFIFLIFCDDFVPFCKMQ